MYTTSNELDDDKVVLFIGRTGSGKTSVFNILTNSNQPLGNSVISTTRTFVTKTVEKRTFIDTIGFHDTDDENEQKLQVILFLREIRNGFDIIFYCLRMDVFTSDEANLFTEIYETILTKKAFQNSCLLITFYTRSDLDEVNTLNSPQRQRILEEFRSNDRYRQILDHFENRILFVDLRQEEELTPYPIGSLRYLRYRTLNELICERKQIVYKHLDKFIECFSPERFDCDNMKNMRDILRRNETLEIKLNEYRQFVLDMAEERSTTGLYDFLRFMPITNMFVDIFELSQREKFTKRIEKLLKN